MHTHVMPMFDLNREMSSSVRAETGDLDGRNQFAAARRFGSSALSFWTVWISLWSPRQSSGARASVSFIRSALPYRHKSNHTAVQTITSSRKWPHSSRIAARN